MTSPRRLWRMTVPSSDCTRPPRGMGSATVPSSRGQTVMTSRRRMGARYVTWMSALDTPKKCPCSVRKDRDRGDLDQGALAEQAAHDDTGGRWIRGTENLPADGRRLHVVLRRGDVLGGLDDVLEASAGRTQDGVELPVDVARLRHDVAGADDAPALVARGRPRDEQEIADSHRGRKRVALGPRPARDHLVCRHPRLLASQSFTAV